MLEGHKVSASPAGLMRFAEAVADALVDAEPHALAATLTQGPATIGRGALGNALFLAEMARLTARERYLAAARDHAGAAARLALTPARGYVVPLPGTAAAFFYSLHGGRAGMAYVAAQIADVAGERTERSRAIAEVAELAQPSIASGFAELYDGAAGFAEAAAGMAVTFNDLAPGDREALGSVCARATDSLLAVAATPLAEGDLLGLAHGRAGVVYAAVRHASADARVEAALSDFAARAGESYGLTVWPAAAGAEPTPDAVEVSWCNGATGMLRLFLRAHRSAPTPLTAKLVNGATTTLAAVRTPNPTLCCGAMGQALALADFSAAARGNPLAALVRSLARQSMRDAAGLPLQMFTGLTGVAFGALSLAHPGTRRPIGCA
jgi:hypothetical protein